MTAQQKRGRRKSVPLEAALEREAVGWLESHEGVWAIKVGLRGWPDRLVLCWNGHHFWLEFKRREFGRLTPAQKRLLPKLERYERIAIVRTLEEVQNAFAAWHG